MTRTTSVLILMLVLLVSCPKPTIQAGWGAIAKLVDPKLMTAIATSVGLDLAKDAITDKDVAKMMDDPRMRDMILQILQHTQTAMNESMKTSSNVITVTYGLLGMGLVVAAIIVCMYRQQIKSARTNANPYARAAVQYNNEYREAQA